MKTEREKLNDLEAEIRTLEARAEEYVCAGKIGLANSTKQYIETLRNGKVAAEKRINAAVQQ